MKQTVHHSLIGFLPWSKIMGERTRVAESKHGTFTYHSDDRFLGASLRIYGEYSEGEVDFYNAVIRPTDVAIEVGANIGALTVPLARRCKRVMAFEPQPENHKLLLKNLRDNSIDNVVVFQYALGSEDHQDHMPSVEEIDNYGDSAGRMNNYGIAELGYGSHEVYVMRLDGVLDGATKVDFMKLDCEGSELEVLKGAENLIEQNKPLLYVENDRPDKSEALLKWLHDHEYKCYWHKPSLFRDDNYRGYIHNIFGVCHSSNMICLRGHKIGSHWLKEEVK